MRIDLVSDVACPWCAIGMSALERALERIGDEVGDVELHLQPFELNPTMPSEGADAAEYLSSKYGLSPEQLEVNRARIAERGADEGFAFGTRLHVWNTFDAHRLLFFAGVEGPPGAQRALKRALLKAYHGDGRNISSHDVLLELAAEAGLACRAGARGAGARRVRGRGASSRALLAGGRHPFRARRHRRPEASDLGRPAERGIRAGAAANRGRERGAAALAAGRAAGPVAMGAVSQHHQPALTRFGVSAQIKEHPMKALRSALLAVAAAAIAVTAPAFAEPEYTTIKLEIDIAKPAKEVWAKVGGYCDISKWLNNVDCVITSGDGGVGTVRVLAGGRVTEILVAQTELSYGYTQPAREGQFYNLYHGFMEARPVTATGRRRCSTRSSTTSPTKQTRRRRMPISRGGAACSRARSRT